MKNTKNIFNDDTWEVLVPCPVCHRDIPEKQKVHEICEMRFMKDRAAEAADYK